MRLKTKMVLMEIGSWAMTTNMELVESKFHMMDQNGIMPTLQISSIGLLAL